MADRTLGRSRLLDARTSPTDDRRPPPAGDALRRLSAKAARLLRESVLTISAMPDRERAWLRMKGGTPEMALSQAERQAEFGIEAALAAADAAREQMTRRAARFRPTPGQIARALDVLQWLNWLKRQNDGARDVRIIVSRAHGTPFWRLAQRMGRSDRTIQRWEAGAVAAIVNRFWREIAAME